MYATGITTEREQLRIAEKALTIVLSGMRDSLLGPILTRTGSATLVESIGAYVDARIAVREREILDALKVMVEASTERS